MNITLRKTLDRAAISMAVICGIHCLVTPVLLVVLPLLATTFWVDENFHLWMLLLVIPTTTLAVWSGCRQHKDKWVVFSAALGLGILISAMVAERLEGSPSNGAIQPPSQELAAESGETLELCAATNTLANQPGAGCCALHPAQADLSNSGETNPSTSPPWPWHALLNTLGGGFLVAGHARNFILCRKNDCSHGEAC